MANYDSFLFIGHGQISGGGFDPGATGNGKREYDMAKQIVTIAKSYLAPLKLNIQFGEQNYENNLTKGNTYNAKWGMSVHINSGGGHGAEMLVPSGEKYFAFESEMLSEMNKLGFTNRGIKSRNYDTDAWYQRQEGVPLGFKNWFKEIRQAWEQSPACSLTIFEVGFIDNAADVNRIVANYDNIGFIVAKYIAKACGRELSKPVAPSIDYEKELCRIYVDGANKIALTGKTKCINYAKSNFVGKIKIQCVKDGKYISEFTVEPKPVAPSHDCKEEQLAKEKDALKKENAELKSTISNLNDKIEKAKDALK